MALTIQKVTYFDENIAETVAAQLLEACRSDSNTQSSTSHQEVSIPTVTIRYDNSFFIVSTSSQIYREKIAELLRENLITVNASPDVDSQFELHVPVIHLKKILHLFCTDEKQINNAADEIKKQVSEEDIQKRAQAILEIQRINKLSYKSMHAILNIPANATRQAAIKAWHETFEPLFQSCRRGANAWDLEADMIICAENAFHKALFAYDFLSGQLLECTDDSIDGYRDPDIVFGVNNHSSSSASLSLDLQELSESTLHLLSFKISRQADGYAVWRQIYNLFHTAIKLRDIPVEDARMAALQHEAAQEPCFVDDVSIRELNKLWKQCCVACNNSNVDAQQWSFIHRDLQILLNSQIPFVLKNRCILSNLQMRVSGFLDNANAIMGDNANYSVDEIQKFEKFSADYQQLRNVTFTGVCEDLTQYKKRFLDAIYDYRELFQSIQYNKSSAKIIGEQVDNAQSALLTFGSEQGYRRQITHDDFIVERSILRNEQGVEYPAMRLKAKNGHIIETLLSCAQENAQQTLLAATVAEDRIHLQQNADYQRYTDPFDGLACIKFNEAGAKKFLAGLCGTRAQNDAIITTIFNTLPNFSSIDRDNQTAQVALLSPSDQLKAILDSDFPDKKVQTLKLIREGVNPNVITEKGFNALLLATQSNDIAFVRELLTGSTQSSVSSRAKLGLLFSSSSTATPPTTQILMQRDFIHRCCSQDANQRSPFAVAIENQNLEMVQLLWQHSQEIYTSSFNDMRISQGDEKPLLPVLQRIMDLAVAEKNAKKKAAWNKIALEILNAEKYIPLSTKPVFQNGGHIINPHFSDDAKFRPYYVNSLMKTLCISTNKKASPFQITLCFNPADLTCRAFSNMADAQQSQYVSNDEKSAQMHTLCNIYDELSDFLRLGQHGGKPTRNGISFAGIENITQLFNRLTFLSTIPETRVIAEKWLVQLTVAIDKSLGYISREFSCHSKSIMPVTSHVNMPACPQLIPLENMPFLSEQNNLSIPEEATTAFLQTEGNSKHSQKKYSISYNTYQPTAFKVLFSHKLEYKNGVRVYSSMVHQAEEEYHWFYQSETATYAYKVQGHIPEGFNHELPTITTRPFLQLKFTNNQHELFPKLNDFFSFDTQPEWGCSVVEEISGIYFPGVKSMQQCVQQYYESPILEFKQREDLEKFQKRLQTFSDHPLIGVYVRKLRETLEPLINAVLSSSSSSFQPRI